MLALSVLSKSAVLSSSCAKRFVKVSPSYTSFGFRSLCSLKVPNVPQDKAKNVPKPPVNKPLKTNGPKAKGLAEPAPTANVSKAPVQSAKSTLVGEVTGENLDETIHTRQYPNGDVYVGQLADGKHHGKGVITYAHGASWKGEFIRGKQHTGYGYSVVDLKSGMGWSKGYYEGPLEAGKRLGVGKMCFEDGSWWEGLFYDGSGITGKGYVPADEGLVECVEKVDGKVVNRSLIPATVVSTLPSPSDST